MTEIYYFSGTGNSMFVAKELAGRIPGSRLIPIAGFADKEPVRTHCESVGFVFPVHALTIPVIVKRFVQRADFSSAKYVFAVATRMGSIFRGFEKMDRLLKKSGRRLDAHFVLNMGNNEARHAGYAVPTGDEIAKIEKEVLEKLSEIADVIRKKRGVREQDTGVTESFGKNRGSRFILEKTVLAGMALSEYIGGVQYFYADDACTGCGVCGRVCLSGKIKIEGKKPVWQKNVFCHMCFACLNYCPARAVQIKSIPGVKSYTRTNGRYPHPYAGVEDIAAQKDGHL